VNAHDERLLDVLLEEALGALRPAEIAERVATRLTSAARRPIRQRASRIGRVAVMAAAVVAIGIAAFVLVKRAPRPGPPQPVAVSAAERARLDGILAALAFDEARLDPADEAAHKAAIMATERAIVDAGRLRAANTRLFAELRPSLLDLLRHDRANVVRRAVAIVVDDEDASSRAALASALARTPAAFSANLVLALAESGLDAAARHMRDFVAQDPEHVESLGYAAAPVFDGDPLSRPSSRQAAATRSSAINVSSSPPRSSGSAIASSGSGRSTPSGPKSGG
jgi:hypothetical protein